MHLLDLPDDVLRIIFSYVSPIAYERMLCKQLANLFDTVQAEAREEIFFSEYEGPKIVHDLINAITENNLQIIKFYLNRKTFDNIFEFLLEFPVPIYNIVMSKEMTDLFAEKILYYEDYSTMAYIATEGNIDFLRAIIKQSDLTKIIYSLSSEISALAAEKVSEDYEFDHLLCIRRLYYLLPSDEYKIIFIDKYLKQ